MKSGWNMPMKDVWLQYKIGHDCFYCTLTLLIVTGYVVLDQRFHNPGINKKVIIIKSWSSKPSNHVHQVLKHFYHPCNLPPSYNQFISKKSLEYFLELVLWPIYYFMIPCWSFKKLNIKSSRFQYKGSSLLPEWWIYSRSDDGWIHTSSLLRQFWLSVAGLAELQLLL